MEVSRIEYELTNNEREFLGLDLIENHWDRVIFNGDKYRPESILYFEGDIIKRHIVSTVDKYRECHYNERTEDRAVLLPRTNKGKEKKLTASVLEQKQPLGIYVNVSFGDLIIGSYNTQTIFYSTTWEKERQSNKNSIANIVKEFIEQSPKNHLNEISSFKSAKRKNVKFKTGDYFAFKINRTEYGFGRLLLDVNKARKKKLLPKEHGLNLLMGPPVIVQLFAYKSSNKNTDLSILEKQTTLSADVMMDNLLLYGEFEIIGNKELSDEEFDFPISYGKSLDRRPIVFLQWGLIHKELSKEKLNKYIVGEKPFDQNPYGYYSIGFEPSYDTIDIAKTISNNGVFDFENCNHYQAKRDLRNPNNKNVKDEIFKVFGLDPEKSYFENCKLTGTVLMTEFLKKLK